MSLSNASSLSDNCAYPAIGYMPMPPDFKYQDICKKGRPQHDRFSRFRLKHPEMPCSRRAKIFAPFDALRGFNEAVASKEVEYTERPILSEEKKEILDRKLALLHKLTYNKKTAGQNSPLITVTRFRPCTDESSESFLTEGTLETVTGICRRADIQNTSAIILENDFIPLDNVVDISGKVVDSIDCP